MKKKNLDKLDERLENQRTGNEKKASTFKEYIHFYIKGKSLSKMKKKEPEGQDKRPPEIDKSPPWTEGKDLER